MNEQFGYEAREAERKRKSTAIKEITREICRTEIDISIISSENYLTQYERVDELLTERFPVLKSYRLARLEFLKFIRVINLDKKLGLPEPAIPLVAYRSSLVLSPELFYQGSYVHETIAAVKSHWHQSFDYDLKTAMAWCLYSAIVFAGVNCEAHLRAFFAAVQQRRTPYRIFQNQLLMCSQLNDTKYGHTFSERGNQAVRDYHVVIDDITALWLIRIDKLVKSEHEICLDNIEFSDVIKVLRHELKKLGFEFKSLSKLYKHGSFHALFQKNSAYDVSMMQLLKHHHSHWSTSLPEQSLQAYFQPKYRKQPQAVLREMIYELDISSGIHKPNKTVNKPAIHRDVMKGLRFYIKADDTDKIKSLHEHFPQPNHSCLISWVVEQRETTNKVNTTLRYLSEFAEDWLSLTYEEDFESLSSHEYLAIYQHIIHSKPTKRQYFTVRQLMSFHDHQIRQYGAPIVEFSQYQKTRIVKAQMLSPEIYERMLDCLQHSEDFRDYQFEKNQCLSLLILAYRSGMRINEIVGLRTKDFELKRYVEVNVKSHRNRRLKTDSSERRLPIWALLTSSEREIVYGYINGQRQAGMKYVFSMGSVDMPIPEHVPRQLFKELLNALLESHDFRFHSLRHTALSQLAMALFSDENSFQWLAGSNNDRWKHIRFALLGKTQAHQTGQHRWMALAAFAGHLQPDVTLRHYVHTAHFLAGMAMTQIDYKLTGAAILNISELSRRRVSEHLASAHQTVADAAKQIESDSNKSQASASQSPRFSSNSEQQLKGLRPIYSYTLSDSAHELSFSPVQLDNAQSSDASHKDTTEIEKTLLKGYSLHAILNCLESIDAGDTLENAAFDADIKYPHAKMWYENAMQLKQVTNSRGKSRLISDDRADKFLPSKPHYREALKCIDEFISQAVAMYSREPEQLNEFLELFLLRVNTSKSTIRFAKKHAADLHRFLSIGLELLATKHWCLFAPQLSNARDFKKKYDMPDRLSVAKHNDYSGFAVTVVQANHKKEYKQDKRFQSFGVLKYVCHVLLILMPASTNLTTTLITASQ